MSRISETKYFNTKEEAEAYRDQFMERFGCHWEGYSPNAHIYPPNDDRPSWAVYTSRFRSSD